ncbi:MAG: hypothetical protein IT379_16460 [Deltaproteobacteria bacterium]|nr:hypothetical protein [Deltaproteobacteria bacterium]
MARWHRSFVLLACVAFPDAARADAPAPAPPRSYTSASAPRDFTLEPRRSPPLPVAGEAEERAEPVEPPDDRPRASVEHVFYLPTARTSGPGLSGEYVSALGWFGIRAGIGSRVDVGLGLPFYLSGVSADARVAVVSTDSFAVAAYGYVSVPLNDEEGVDFSTSATGIAYAIGPTASLWGDEASVHAGVHLGGRTARGGLWLLAHSSLELKITRLVSALVSGVALVELSREDDAPRDARTFPYVAAGARIGGRSFAVDCGLLVPLDRNAPGSLRRLPVTPMLSMGHRW